VVPWDTWEASRAEFLTRMVEGKDITSEHQEIARSGRVCPGSYGVCGVIR
jgi:hypothetical protein